MTIITKKYKNQNKKKKNLTSQVPSQPWITQNLRKIIKGNLQIKTKNQIPSQTSQTVMPKKRNQYKNQLLQQ